MKRGKENRVVRELPLQVQVVTLLSNAAFIGGSPLPVLPAAVHLSAP